MQAPMKSSVCMCTGPTSRDTVDVTGERSRANLEYTIVHAGFLGSRELEANEVSLHCSMSNSFKGTQTQTMSIIPRLCWLQRCQIL